MRTMAHGEVGCPTGRAGTVDGASEAPVPGGAKPAAGPPPNPPPPPPAIGRGAGVGRCGLLLFGGHRPSHTTTMRSRPPPGGQGFAPKTSPARAPRTHPTPVHPPPP